MINTSKLSKKASFKKIKSIIDKNKTLDGNLYDLKSPNKEFEKLLNSQLSKNKIEEGKIIEGKVTKITEKFVFIFISDLKVNQ